MAESNSEFYITIRRIIFFIIIIFSLDWIIGKGLEYLYFRQRSGSDARMTFGIESTTADILILGSSSASNHYVPSIFKEVFKLETYNLGRDGIDILNCNAIFKIILNRYIPKLVILNLTPDELTDYLGYGRLSGLLPYCNKYPELKKTIYLKSNSEKWKLISRIYPYNSTFLTILRKIYYSEEDTNIHNGYVPLYRNINVSQLGYEFIGTYKDLDQNRIIALDEIIDLCLKKGIYVYLFISPLYNYSNSESVSIKKTVEISNKRNIVCVDFTSDDRFKGQASLFQDNGHMNHNGAIKYSKIVAEYILIDIKSKK